MNNMEITGKKELTGSCVVAIGSPERENFRIKIHFEDTHNMQPEPTKGVSRSRKWLIYLAFFGAMGALIFSQLPRGSYSTDLTRIGDGRPALVLAYDISSMGGTEVMKLMDALREEYSDRVVFLVADLGTPHGYGF